jgi:hypothetical protein
MKTFAGDGEGRVGRSQPDDYEQDCSHGSPFPLGIDFATFEPVSLDLTTHCFNQARSPTPYRRMWTGVLKPVCVLKPRRIRRCRSSDLRVQAMRSSTWGTNIQRDSSSAKGRSVMSSRQNAMLPETKWQSKRSKAPCRTGWRRCGCCARCGFCESSGGIQTSSPWSTSSSPRANARSPTAHTRTAHPRA